MRSTSLESLTKDHLIKFSKVLDAKYVEKLFNADFSYCAITYRSGSNSPWSTKTKDILDSCLSYTAYQIERFKLYELPKNKNKYNFDYDQMTEAFLPSLSDIKKYLKEFLSDNRIIEVNKFLWWFILNIIILNHLK